MPTEAKKRKHRCCFSGHRPEKLDEDETTVRAWLETQIKAAIASGFTTFITGCAMGVDIWTGQIVLKLCVEGQNEYNFCVKLDRSDAMKAAAERVLDENYLPSHSEQYREAYHPAYWVLYKDFRKFRRDEE